MKLHNAAKFTLISLLITLPLSSALGGELSAVFNGKSIHVNASEDWNEDNYGLGLEYQFAMHRNLFATDRLNGFYLDAGISAFFMTRKDVDDNKPFPGALPSLTIGNRYAGLNLSYLPKNAIEKMYDSKMDDETISGIVFLQFKVNFGQLMADN
jgi:hypothetical protein